MGILILKSVCICVPLWLKKRGKQNFRKKVLHGATQLLFCSPAFAKMGSGIF